VLPLLLTEISSDMQVSAQRVDSFSSLCHGLSLNFEERKGKGKEKTYLLLVMGQTTPRHI
jgi:hypothetical protein